MEEWGNPFDAVKGQVESLVKKLVQPMQNQVNTMMEPLNDMKKNFDNMIGPVIQFVNNLANKAEQFIFPFLKGLIKAVYDTVDTIFDTLGLARNGVTLNRS